MEEQNKPNKRSPFVYLTLVFGIISILLFVVLYDCKTGESSETSLCSKISGTPAWVNSEGEIVFQGYTDFGKNQSSTIVEKLIQDKIYFLYSPGCGWCQKQIEYFGNNWNKYLESGLVIDCSQEGN